MSRIGGDWAGCREPDHGPATARLAPGRPNGPNRSRRPDRPDYLDPRLQAPGSRLRAPGARLRAPPAPGSAWPCRCPADQDQDVDGEPLINF